MNTEDYLWDMIQRSACVFHGYKFDEETRQPAFVARSEWSGTAGELCVLLRGDKSMLTFEERILVPHSPCWIQKALERLSERLPAGSCDCVGVYTKVWTLRPTGGARCAISACLDEVDSRGDQVDESYRQKFMEEVNRLSRSTKEGV